MMHRFNPGWELVPGHEARDCCGIPSPLLPCRRDRHPELDGEKKARLLVQPGFFCDPVGIRTPNLRIRSAMLYPVELQSRSSLTVR